MGDVAAQEPAVALEGGEDGVGVLAAERHDEDGGELEVGRHAHFRHGDDRALQRRVVDLAALEDVGQRVADQFADAKLALGGGMRGVALGHGGEAWTLRGRVAVTASA